MTEPLSIDECVEAMETEVEQLEAQLNSRRPAFDSPNSMHRKMIGGELRIARSILHHLQAYKQTQDAPRYRVGDEPGSMVPHENGLWVPASHVFMCKPHESEAYKRMQEEGSA